MSLSDIFGASNREERGGENYIKPRKYLQSSLNSHSFIFNPLLPSSALFKASHCKLSRATLKSYFVGKVRAMIEKKFLIKFYFLLIFTATENPSPWRINYLFSSFYYYYTGSKI